MVEYHCANCDKKFNKKSNYDYHINRIRPCIKNAPNCPKIAPNCPKIAPKMPQIAQKSSNLVALKTIDNIDLINNDNKKFSCDFCNKTFVKKYGLKRHLESRCKLKQEQLNVENKTIENDEKYNLILKRLNDLENENKKLKNKKTTNININQPNININQNNLLVNFDDLKYNNVDKKLFIQPIMNIKLFGKAIILQMIENIHINKNYPEYQNIIITDKNRGYVKIYNNGKWKTDDINIINMVIDGIISQSKTILVELKNNHSNEINLNNNQIKNRLNISEKYINFCDSEHLEDLKDDDVDNTKEIKRCEEFREMVYKETINLFHDNKNLLLKQNKINKLLEIA